MTFRPATYDDAALLLRWRRADENNGWYEGHNTAIEEHVRWLALRLKSPLVKLLIWEEHGKPVDTVRIDSNGEVAFHCENDKAAVRMLHATRDYAKDYGGRLKATVDTGNSRSWELLARAGFTEHPCRFLAYKP